MKKQTIFCHILLPTMIVLLLLPPLSCLIFRHAAEKYAYAEAVHDLELLQQNILPLMQNSFSNDSDTDDVKTPHVTRPGSVRPGTRSPDISRPKTDGTIANLSESVRNFLFQINSLMRTPNGNAKLIIFESRMHVIYPRDEQEREALTPLALDFIKYIQGAENTVAANVTELESSDGQSYLINIYEAPMEFTQVKYVVAYSAVSEIGSWVRDASILVLIISSVFVLLIFVVLWLAIRSITHPLHKLCREADQIGSGSFSEIESSFQLKELEDLRLAMNQMSGQLRHSDEVQRDFFQNVSHELRNPLMSISGYAQGIEQERFSSPKDAAHTILTESGRLTRLVNSLLTLSRMESGPNSTTLNSVLIIDTIEECLDRMNGLALKHGIAVSLISFDETLRVCGDEELICKVLENLLTNAIRYAKTTVTVSVTSEQKLLCISVADDGEGISETDLPHIFERCYKGKGGNFGIGLAIARSAAQKMGGSLSAANTASGGAVFTLCLKRL
ncbi:sensor histidine kinase [Clostridium transplantifaecale]|uniref:sensor histidine kinase n=1 Tax=Clostridium transplantifaecale TaxID=2479838 RepID=UPI000F63290A|nr:HAMP domain-containing sensor histidine kinase [Clostridium transplantifaecale]